MATELIDGDIIQYTLRARYMGQTILNTWMFRVTQFEPAGVDYEDSLEAVMMGFNEPAGLIEDLQALTVNTYSFIEHRMQRVYPTRNRAVTIGISEAGGLSPPGVQVNTAAVVTKLGNTAGRFAVGSWHQTGFPATDFLQTGLVETTIKEALVLALEPLANVILVPGFTGTSLQPILWSYKVPARVTPIQDIVGQDTVRVMRRRTVGLGI